MMKRKTTKEELCELYWEKEYSIQDIAKMFDCAPQTLWKRFKEFGIKSRTLKEARRTEGFKKRHHELNVGKNNAQWKGGITQDSRGYILVKKRDHPRSPKNGYVQRAHLVAEEMLGRYLYPSEITHHKNGIKDDDRPENIEVTTTGKHTAFHNKGR